MESNEEEERGKQWGEKGKEGTIRKERKRKKRKRKLRGKKRLGGKTEQRDGTEADRNRNREKGRQA